MSTDTTQMREHYELQIQKFASIDLCKECYAAHIDNGKLHCTHPDPNSDSCNVIRIYGDF